MNIYTLIIDSFASPTDTANQSFWKHFGHSLEPISFQEVTNEERNVPITTLLDYAYLLKLKLCKSAGSDYLSPRLFVVLADVMTGPLTHLFCLFIETTDMPLNWKLANICPVPTKIHPKIDDLRPISMLPVFSKILERIVLSSVKKPYSPRQFGFRPHSSVLHVHITLHNFTTTKLESDLTDGIMLISTDLKSVTFDSLSHDKLLLSLSKVNFLHTFLQCCRSFLDCRSQ